MTRFPSDVISSTNPTLPTTRSGKISLEFQRHFLPVRRRLHRRATDGRTLAATDTLEARRNTVRLSANHSLLLRCVCSGHTKQGGCGYATARMLYVGGR